MVPICCCELPGPVTLLINLFDRDSECHTFFTEDIPLKVAHFYQSRFFFLETDAGMAFAFKLVDK